MNETQSRFDSPFLNFKLIILTYYFNLLFYFKHIFKGGGGGGGFSPDFCENTILRYELAMMARTCTNNLRVVLSPYVQHCPCEALEQKWAPKTKFYSKEIELSF